ncbi:MAG: MBL fold metallo-hydrolase [Solobacterium sp.]|nr:MBL fold metallo-hydrolase [Solobacterium sp.]
MRFVNFASSSSGNCYWIELERSSGKPVKLLVEAGIPYKEIVSKTIKEQLVLTDLDAVLITHSHSDHCKAAKQLAERGFKVYGNQYVCGSFREQLYPDTLKVVAPDTYVVPFRVEHDAPDPFGYVIYTDVEKILFIADNKFWKADLSSQVFDYVIIEANYDGSIMHFALENARENFDRAKEAQYKRVINSHLSLKNCEKQLLKMNLSNCKAIFLIHLSDRHSNENLFKRTIQEATKVRTFVCKKNGGII